MVEEVSKEADIASRGSSAHIDQLPAIRHMLQCATFGLSNSWTSNLCNNCPDCEMSQMDGMTGVI